MMACQSSTKYVFDCFSNLFLVDRMLFLLLAYLISSNWSLIVVPLGIIAVLPSFFLSSLTGGPFSAEPSQYVYCVIDF